ncbi:MAG: LamG domain-containing protein [Candidatus Bathyarchaeota archaeon]|nr:LamG domain-containing protein [Candidatus Bathyarchaeota archaeon]
MSKQKVIVCLLLFLFFIEISGVFEVSGSFNYDSSVSWGFDNNTYLTFGQDVDLAYVPQKGSIYNSALVGNWAMDETSGTLVTDSSGNGNNGTAINTIIVPGKYGNARYFNNSGAIVVSDSESLKLNLTGFSLSATVKLDEDAGTLRTVLRKGITGYNPYYCLRVNAENKVEFILRDAPEPAHSYTLTTAIVLPANEWVTISVTYNYTSKWCYLYINGESTAQMHAVDLGDFSSDKSFAIGQASDVAVQHFKGSIDEVKIYNKPLSADEIFLLYTEPDPAILTNYYNFVDANTEAAMVIHVQSLADDFSNSCFVNCTDFFTDNKLIFIANGSVTVNVWTTFGKPFFTSGIWNSENYTITLALDDASNGIISWVSCSPVASNMSVTSTYSGCNSTFSVLWTDTLGLTNGGGYIFSTNNTGHWVNATWSAFISNPDWGNVTLTLNNTVDVIVSFREYANNSLGIWNASEIYSIKTIASNILPTSTPNPTSTPTPTFSTSTPPSPTPSPNQELISMLSKQVILLVAVMIAVFLVFFVSFKRGIIKIEIVDNAGL